jgi:hypothetical protein
MLESDLGCKPPPLQQNQIKCTLLFVTPSRTTLGVKTMITNHLHFIWVGIPTVGAHGDLHLAEQQLWHPERKAGVLPDWT